MKKKILLIAILLAVTSFFIVLALAGNENSAVKTADNKSECPYLKSNSGSCGAKATKTSKAVKTNASEASCDVASKNCPHEATRASVASSESKKECSAAAAAKASLTQKACCADKVQKKKATATTVSSE